MLWYKIDQIVKRGVCMKKKGIPYSPKPRNAFERGLFKYFEGERDQEEKEKNQKKKSSQEKENIEK